MKQYTITITRLNNQDKFCEALKQLSGQKLDIMYSVLSQIDFPINLNDIFSKFSYSNPIVFNENKVKMIKGVIKTSADLEIKQIISKTIEVLPEEIFENKKRVAEKLKIEVKDFVDAEIWKNSLNETDIKRLNLLQRIERYMNTPR